MRLVYIVNARIPTEKAHGYQISKMCEQFSEQGFEVELWKPRRANPIKDSLFDYYGLKNNFKVRTINSFDALRFVKIFGRFAFFLQSWLFFLKLIFVKSPAGAFVYTRDPAIAWLFSKKGGKVYYECHEWFGKDKTLSLFFLRSAPQIVVTNSYIGAEFVKHGFDAKNILKAPNGIDLDIFDLDILKSEAVKKLPLSFQDKKQFLDNFVLLYTGTFKVKDFEKGILNILEALKILNDKNLFFAAVGGSGRDIKYYQEIAQSLGVKNQIRLLGRVSQKELALFQKAADALLMPFSALAHFEYFMSPLKMFEYMASGRPIIASDLSSIREILNENNCLFCRPGDSNNLAQQIKLLKSHRELGEKIARQALIDVKQFLWSCRAYNILNFLGVSEKKKNV